MVILLFEICVSIEYIGDPMRGAVGDIVSAFSNATGQWVAGQIRAAQGTALIAPRTTRGGKVWLK
jgi:hypothetical protein